MPSSQYHYQGSSFMETLFQFNFDNPFGFLLPFTLAIINLSLVVYIFFFFVRNRVTTVFSLLTLALACWQFNSAFGRIAATAKTAAAWEYFFLVPWSMVGPLCLHFALLYTQIVEERKWRPLLISSYLISLFFIGIYNAGVYEHHFVYLGYWGWVDEHKDNIVDIISVGWLTFLTIASIIILASHTLRVRRDGDYFYQSLLIAIGIITPAIIGIITQFLLPIFFQVDSIPLTAIFMSVFSVSTVIALSKYNLFRASDIYDLEKLLDRIPAYVICINEDEKINYINEYSCNRLSRTKKQLINSSISEVFDFTSLDYSKRFIALVKAALNGKDSLNFETAILINKQEIHTLMSIRPIEIESKIQGVIISIRDITEVYKTHELIERSELRLREAQKVAKIGSWEWDIVKNEVSWSDEVFRIYGMENDGKKRSYEDFLKTIHEADRSKINELIQHAYLSKEPYSYTRKVGGNKYVQANGYVVVNERGIVEKMYGTVQDVTAIVEKEIQLKAQNEELQKINAELDRFVYSVSHDLRSPLTSIEGLVNIAIDDTKETATKEMLMMIQSSTYKLDKFIQDILHYSRNARMDVHLDNIDLQQLLKEIIEQHQLPSQNKVQINVSIKAPQPLVTDKTRLLLILNNLISNSIRYANPADPRPFVEIEIGVYARKAFFYIKDNGQGIADEIQPHIFKMFFRGNRDSIGSGLGLYIVKEAVEKLNGKVSLDSQLGKGTTFTIEIPNHVLESA